MTKGALCACSEGSALDTRTAIGHACARVSERERERVMEREREKEWDRPSCWLVSSLEMSTWPCCTLDFPRLSRVAINSALPRAACGVLLLPHKMQFQGCCCRFGCLLLHPFVCVCASGEMQHNGNMQLIYCKYFATNKCQAATWHVAASCCALFLLLLQPSALFIN